MATLNAPQQHRKPTDVRRDWDNIAIDFDRHTTPLALRLGEEVIERAGVQRGDRFLDVGAGSGALSIPAARRGAHVLATDVSPQMVTLLLDRAKAGGFENLEARAMDGNALDLDDNSFDVTASQNGVSVFPDVARGLAEMVRVTRPGGRVVVVCFGAIQEAEFLTFFKAALRVVVPEFPGIPMNPPPLPFQLANPDDLRHRLDDAQLSNVNVHLATWEMHFDSGQHLWDTVTSSNPLAVRMVAGLTDTQREETKTILDGMLRERSGAAGGTLRNAVNIGIGTK